MRKALNENKTLTVLTIVLALVILGALYYYVVYPKIEHEKNVKNSIQQLTIEKRQLEEEILAHQEEGQAPINTFELRRKLPETRAVSELLLSLQEAELISEADIQSIAFNNYDGLVSESGYGVTGEEDLDEAGKTEEEKKAEREKEKQEKEKEEGAEDVPETEIDVESLPPSLKLLSFNVQVEVQDYDHLLKFIKEIEAIERVKRIENITFTQGGEADLEVPDADEVMMVTLQVTTFYAEGEVD